MEREQVRTQLVKPVGSTHKETPRGRRVDEAGQRVIAASAALELEDAGGGSFPTFAGGASNHIQ